MFYVGADGCKAGWFTVKLGEGNDWEVNLFPSIGKLWEQYKEAGLILLDIPIGLRDKGREERRCDIEARKLLGRNRGSSVFPAPCRAAVYAGTYQEAKEINLEKTGRSLSNQTCGIISKIREVDQLLSRDRLARSHIREIHPELCFWALNGSRPMEYSKKKENGFLERKQVLSSIYPYTQDIVNYALQKYHRKKVAKDDILDALAAAVTALAEEREFYSIPETVEFDSHGIRMEMAYRLPVK